jgi:hypothetical protein
VLVATYAVVAAGIEVMAIPSSSIMTGYVEEDELGADRRLIPV